MMAILTGVFFGVTLGLCVSPVWMMLSLPMRVTDALNAGSMRLCAMALMLGAVLAALAPFSCRLGDAAGITAMLGGGIFVGMLASALTEALDVIPVLYHKLRIPGTMRSAAWALLVGKTVGALLAGWLVI